MAQNYPLAALRLGVEFFFLAVVRGLSSVAFFASLR
jgi:hypothetical protein